MSESLNVQSSSDDSLIDITADTTTTTETTESTAVTESTPVDSTNFLASIPEEFRSEACLKDIPDSATLVKNYINAQKLIGGSVRIPGENATPEEKAAFYTKLGRPETPDGYEIKSSIENYDKIVDVLPHVDTAISDFTLKAHEMGIPKATAQALAKWQVEQASSDFETLIEAKKAEKASAEAKLKELWGAEFDSKRALASQVAKKLATKYPDDMDKLLQSDAARNPAVLVMLAELGNTYKEHMQAGTVQAESKASSAVAQQKLDAVFKDSNHPYHNPNHRDYLKAVDEVNALYETVYRK